MRHSLRLFLCALLCLPLPLRAETVSLEKALRETITHRPAVVAARAEAAGAGAFEDEAKSRYLPRLALSEHLSWTDEPASSLFIDLNQEDLVLSQDAGIYNFPPSRRDFETRLSLEQPLYNPDIAYGRRRASAAAHVAAAEAQWMVEQAAFATFKAYLVLQQAHAALESARSSEQEARETQRLAEERYRAGMGLKAEQLRARVAAAAARQRVRRAENDLVLARRSLSLSMGRDGEGVDMEIPLSPELFAEAAGENVLRREDLAALGSRSREAELAVAQSRARYLPRAALAASYSLHDADPFGTDAGSWKLGASLSWQLFDGGARRHGIVGAEEKEKAIRQQWLEAARQARFRVDEARLRADEARLALETARQSVLEAEESRNQIEQRYQAGLTDLSTLLEVQSTLDRSRYELSAATTDLVLSLGRIHFEKGIFVQTLLPAVEVGP